MAGALTAEEAASLYRRHAGMVYQISLMRADADALKEILDAYE